MTNRQIKQPTTTPTQQTHREKGFFFKPIQQHTHKEQEPTDPFFAASSPSTLARPTLQRQSAPDKSANTPISKGQTDPQTGLPQHLKNNIENYSGLSMADVKVHYNSNQPRQLNALAYAQGTDIHLDMGQEAHLPHEAWHVVQQKQGRVTPTLQLKSQPINNDHQLEKEADAMGQTLANAPHSSILPMEQAQQAPLSKTPQQAAPIVQRMKDKYGYAVPINWANLTPDEAHKLLIKVGAKELIPDNGDVAKLNALVSSSRRAAPVNYSGAQSSSGFNSRAIYSSTTNYAPNPTDLAQQEIQGDPFHANMYGKILRGTMSDAFTQQMETAPQNQGNPHRDAYQAAGSLSAAGVARTHRLADSSIKSILCVALFNYNAKNQKHKQALKIFFLALGSPNGFDAFMQAVQDAYTQKASTRSHLQSAITLSSMTTTNVTFGDAEINERISNAYDPHFDITGNMTPISASIEEAVQDLADAGLIPQTLADSTTTQASDKKTGVPLSSTSTWL